MGSSFFFIEAPGSHSDVLQWFRDLPQPPEETPTGYGLVLYFRGFGPLVVNASGELDATRSPVVTLVMPVVRREILWTVGEVHFRSTLYLDQNKSIQKVARSFTKWMKRYPQVYDQALNAENPLAYYIEGTAKNWGSIYALPSGLAHLERGGYSVSHRDGESVLEKLCRSLRLRGIECGAATGRGPH